MARFFTGDYKNKMDFEYGEFHPFYSELERFKKDTDRVKIERSIATASVFFNKFVTEKNKLIEPGVKVSDVLLECENLIKTISVPDDDILEKIIKQDGSARWLVLFGERLGGHCAISGVSSSQIRNIYGQVKKLELLVAIKPETELLDALSQRKLILLIPRLAYAAKRQEAITELSNVLSRSIKKIITVGDFMRFSQYFEAILAYHKAFGGK
jgi:CRISPR-associated protein Csm2